MALSGYVVGKGCYQTNNTGREATSRSWVRYILRLLVSGNFRDFKVKAPRGAVLKYRPAEAIKSQCETVLRLNDT